MSVDDTRTKILPLILGEKKSERAMQSLEAARELLADDAEFIEPQAMPDSRTPLEVGDCDAVAVSPPLSVASYADAIAGAGKPVLLLEPHCAFHPYQAGARAALTAAGGRVLPTDSPEAILNSVRAIAAMKRLRSSKALLFVGDPGSYSDLEETAESMLGVNVEVRDVEELKEEARGVPDATAASTLAEWKEKTFSRIDGVADEHLAEVARLYHAEKNLLARHGANALGVEEFDPFLHQKLPMPNVTYALLKDEGIVCTEEADLGCLLTQLLMYAASGEQNTMSNIYMAFRSELEKRGPSAGYTPQMQLADYNECLADNCLVVSHFSTAGSLPRNMMVEDTWEVRETIGAWPDQSMVYSTPKTGPVTLARLDQGLEHLDVYPAETAEVRKFDHLGWYRCRWLVRVGSAKTFVDTAIHHHYAIAPGHPDPVLRTLVTRLLGIRIRRY